MKNTLLHVALSVPALTFGLVGQDRGPAAAWAQGLAVAGSSEIVEKPPGDQQSPPTPFADTPGTLVPVFRVESLLGTDALGHVFLDAMSTGNDFLPIGYEAPTTQHPNGYYFVAPGGGPLRFAFMTVSVRQELGLGNASAATVLGQRWAATGGQVGGDIYSYWFKGNTNVPPEFVDRAYFVSGAEHSGLPADQDIDALDTYMPLIVASGAVNSGWVQRVDRWYFSISPSSATWIQDNWTTTVNMSARFDPQMASAQVTAATVFMAQWTPSGWEPIVALFSPDSMGLSEEDDIDALAYHAGQSQQINSGNHKVVYSLRQPEDAPISTISQIRVAKIGALASTGESFDLLINDGRRIEDPIGIPVNVGNVPYTGDVDAICGFDPENQRDFWMAAPYGTGSSIAGFGASVERYVGGGGLHYLKLMAMNLPQGPGSLTWAVSINGSLVSTISVKVPKGPTSEIDMSVQPTYVDIMTIRAMYRPNGSPVLSASWPLEINY